MKGRVRRIVGVGLIVVGVLILGYAGVAKWLGARELAPWREAADELEREIPADTFTGGVGPPPCLTLPPKLEENLQTPGVVAALYLTKTKELIPVRKAATIREAEKLQTAAGIIPWDTLRTWSGRWDEEGVNVGLAGHATALYAAVFNRLEEYAVGDSFLVFTREGAYAYRVFDVRVVKETEVWVLDPVPGKAVVTLVTCTPKGAVHPDRLIVRGELVRSYGAGECPTTDGRK
ncbi:MAG: sortase [Brockia lithotrophica]|nr:sortase [Brockia lithotrophica]